MGSVTCNPQLDVTNGTESDCLIAQVAAHADVVDKSGALKDAYRLDLISLPKGAMAKTIKAGTTSSVEVVLDTSAATVEAIQADLIAMDAASLFPLARVIADASPCEDKNGKCAGDYDCGFSEAFSVTRDAQSSMKSSLDFYGLLLADPTANKAAAFTALLNNVKDGKTEPEALSAQIDAFFKALSAPLNACSFDSFAAAFSFATGYAPVWVNLQSAYTYNLFTPSDTSTAAKPAWKSVGKIEFKKTRTELWFRTGAPKRR